MTAANETPVDKGEGVKPPGYYISSTCGLFPAPLPQNSQQIDRAVKLFHFLGIFIGKALQDNRLVDLPLSDSFLKLICRAGSEMKLNSSNTFLITGTVIDCSPDILIIFFTIIESKFHLNLIISQCLLFQIYIYTLLFDKLIISFVSIKVMLI
jgi:hypothetical protein